MISKPWTLPALAILVTVAAACGRQAPTAIGDAPPPRASASQAASGPATEGADPGQWTMDYTAALAKAAESGLPLLLNFTGSDWCGWCRLMDKQVFSTGDWQAWARDNLILVWIDFPKDKNLVPDKYRERNDALSQQYGVRGFPTYFVLDSDGRTVLGTAGAERDITPKTFIAKIEAILISSEKSVAALRATMNAEDQALLDAAREAHAQARKKLDDWLETQPDETPENIALFQTMRQDILTTETQFISVLRNASASK